jgi:hypothetical protein
MKLRNLYNVSEFLPNRCSAIRTGRSRVIACHSRDIGVDCLLFRNHYKDHGRVMCGIMTWKVTPPVLIKVDKVAVCGSCGQVFESTSHIP